MSAVRKIKQEVQHAASGGNTATGKRTDEACAFFSRGIRVVEIDSRAYSAPDLAVARFLISQGQLIEELVIAGVAGGSRE